MKKIVYTLFALLLLIVATNCSPDDGLDDKTNPELSDFKTEISTAPAYEFRFQGTLTDGIGIASIQIYYPEWNLDKVIVVNDKAKEYLLNYKFLTPEDAVIGSSHIVEITVTDSAGNKTIVSVNVTINLDIVNPTVQFLTPINGTNHVIGNPLTVNVSAADNVSLKSLEVKSEILNLNDVLNFSNNETSYNYLEQIQIPAGITGNVTIQAKVTDMNDNVTVANVSILLSTSQVFTQVFLVGGSTWYGWNPAKATKMWQSPQNNQVFIAEFYYTTGSGVKLIGQLDWGPNNWGLNPNNSAQLINSQNSLEINFPDGDGYYRVEFNPYQLQYTFQKLTINISERNNMYIMGKGFVGNNLNWNPADAIPMIRDVNNPYVFSVDLQFSNEVELKYLGQNTGWGPYDAGFVNGGQMQLPINYVKGVVGGGTPDLKFTNQAGSYRIKYDYYLLRTTIQPL